MKKLSLLLLISTVLCSLGLPIVSGEVVYSTASAWQGSTGSYTFSGANIDQDAANKCIWLGGHNFTEAFNFNFSLEDASSANNIVAFPTNESSKLDANNEFCGGKTMAASWGVYYNANQWWYDNSAQSGAPTEGIDDYQLRRLSNGTFQILKGGSVDKQWTQNYNGRVGVALSGGGLQDFNNVNWEDLSTAGPTFTSSTLNNSEPKQDDVVEISVNVTSTTVNITGFVFSWDNGTGTFVNDSFIGLPLALLQNLSVNKTIETVAGSVMQFQWFVNLTDGTWHSSTIESFIVENVSLDDCSTFTTTTLNFSYYDEGNNSPIYADSDATFNYQFTTLIDKTLTLDENNNLSFDVCMNPSDITLTGDYEVASFATDYPLRRYYDTSAIYNNQKQTIKLYLLKADDGIYIRFKVTDVSGGVLPDAEIVMKRLIGSTLTTVEIETTDDSGLATFWANPDIDYTFTATKSGYTPETFTLRPTTSEIITIILGSGEAEQESKAEGISHFFNPKGILANNTNYTFEFNLSSQNWEITACSLYLINESQTLSSASGSFNGSLCGASVLLNTGKQDTIIAMGYYQLNSTYNFNVTYQYSVRYVYQGQFSLMTLFDDIAAFGGSGFNAFTRTMVAFMAVMFIVGFAAMESSKGGLGIGDETALILITLSAIWIFSYVGYFTITLSSIPDIPTLNITQAFLQQWLVFIFSSLAGGSFIIKNG